MKVWDVISAGSSVSQQGVTDIKFANLVRQIFGVYDAVTVLAILPIYFFDPGPIKHVKMGKLGKLKSFSEKTMDFPYFN